MLRAVNKGRTPAELVEGHCLCRYEKAGQFVPQENVYAPFIAPLQTITVNDDSFEIFRVDPEYMASQMQNAPFPMMVYLYGKISYWDTFTDRTAPGAKPSETSWCLNYNPRTKRWHRSASGETKNT